MAKYIGQIKGEFSANYDLTNELKNILFDAVTKEKVDKIIITKIGIQATEGVYVRINNVLYEMNPSRILEYEDVAINKLSFRHRDGGSGLIPVIVDLVCEVTYKKE